MLKGVPVHSRRNNDSDDVPVLEFSIIDASKLKAGGTALADMISRAWMKMGSRRKGGSSYGCGRMGITELSSRSNDRGFVRHGFSLPLLVTRLAGNR